MATAEVLYTNAATGEQEIKLSTGHTICTERNYCYEHQSFDCFEQLTADEKTAWMSA